LPQEIQVKLLRALQDGEIDPIGSRRPVKVDFRLISATNRSLANLVEAGEFREDLYYRLNVFPIRVPPLRERPEDIPELARHFMARFAAEEGKLHLRSIEPTAMALLAAYHWPGNIRQLENTVFRAVVLSDGEALTREEFPQIAAHFGSAAPGPLPSGGEAHDIDGERGADATAPSTDPALLFPAVDAPGQNFRAFEDGEVRRISDVEADLIKLAIEHYGGRMSLVARRLGIGRSTLYRKLREIDPVAAEEAAE